MLKLDSKIDLDLSKFFRWWGAELAFLVPDRLLKLLIHQRAHLVLQKVEEAIDLSYSDQVVKRQLGRFSLDESGSRRRARLLEEQPLLAEAELLLLLAPEQYLQRILKLPAAAEENLRQVIGFEMDRLTPFKAEQVYFDVRVRDRLPETRQIRVDLVLTPRSKLDPLLDELAAFGWRPERVDVGPELTGRGYDLLPEKFRVPRNRLPQILNWVSGGVFSIMLIAVLLVPLAMERSLVEQLQQELKAAGKRASEVESLKAEAEKRVHENGFLVRKKREEPAMVDMLDELSRVIPDTTWLNGLQYRDRKVVIQGQSPAASSLIERIEASSTFKNVSFVSPVTKDIASGQERFQIASEVMNGRFAENPPQ